MWDTIYYMSKISKFSNGELKKLNMIVQCSKCIPPVTGHIPPPTPSKYITNSFLSLDIGLDSILCGPLFKS